MPEFRKDQSIRNDHIQSRAIVIRNGKILVMFRRKNKEEYYVIPGGHMRDGETPEETATREVEEETTVKINTLKPAYEITDYAGKRPNKEYYFTAEWQEGEPILSGEESGRSDESNFFLPMWIPLTDVPKLLLYPLHLKEWISTNLINV